MVVSITGGPESEILIRRGSRIAARAGAELLVLHVLRGDSQGHTRTAAGPDWPASLAGCRTLTDEIGGTFHTSGGR